MKTTTRRGKKKNRLIAIATAGLLALATACGSSSGVSVIQADTADVNENALLTENIFPSDFTVASPLDTVLGDDSLDLSRTTFKLATTGGDYVPAYAFATASINEILNATTVNDCTFDPELFLAEDDDADCYGPALLYQGHPDATGGVPDSGELPPHDVGIWLENDATTGHACMAAELNARMQGVRYKSMAALSGLASMVCVLNANGYTLPNSSTLDLSADMNALGITDVTFTAVSLAHLVNGDGDDEYAYNLEFNYTSGGNSYDILVDMTHVPGTAPVDEYSGQLSYVVGGGTGITGGNCPDSSTHNASMQYVRQSPVAMDVQVHSGEFCGASTDGRDADGNIDPSDRYDALFNPEGWGDGFDVFTASYDPTTLGGNYAYAWQAGPQDENARVFNLNVLAQEKSETTVVTGFYGYGDEIAATDGSVQGMICNWAGPGNDRTLTPYAQRQLLGYEKATGTFSTKASEITYAPTVSCEYDGSGSFVYDTDADGDLSDEAGGAVTQKLYPASDIDGDGTVNSVFETIEAAGFVLPVM